MARVFILEEQDGHDVEFKGEAPRNYLVSEMGADDYVERNRQLLYDFLRVQERFPLYLSFTVYEGMYEELHAMFCAENIEHTVETWDVKNNYSSYYPHCFRVVVKDVIELELLLKETFWLPAQNEFYAISFTENLRFVTKEVPIGKKRLKKVSVPTFQTDEPATFFIIEADAQGFFLFSNEDEYATVDQLVKRLPEETTVCQINDTMFEAF